MNAIGILLCDIDAKANDSWDALPNNPYGKYTYEFPVIRETIPGASEQKIVDSGGDLSMTPHVVNAAKKLEQRGAKAIVGGCGFFAFFQKNISRVVSVPVALSSLLQVPIVFQMIGKDRRVGIITWSKRYLGEQHFNAVGWSSQTIPIAVGKGLEEFPVWKNQNFGPDKIPLLESVMREIAIDLLKENPDLGAFVYEGAALGFTPAIQKATGLPVFNLATLVRSLYSGVCFT